MSAYFLDKITFENDTYELHDTEARQTISDNTQNIDAVTARTATNEADISSLENQVNGIDGELTTAQGDINSLKSSVSSIDGRVKSNEIEIDTLDTRMENAEDDIGDINSRVSTAEGEIGDLQSRMNTTEAKDVSQDVTIENLKEQTDTHTTEITNIKTDLSGVHDTLNEIGEHITATTYEAGVGIYFGKGVDHTNINVEDELLAEIHQNTTDVSTIKTDVSGLKNAKVPTGGTTGQVLSKVDNSDYNMEWRSLDVPVYYYSDGSTFSSHDNEDCLLVINRMSSNDPFWDTNLLNRYFPMNIVNVLRECDTVINGELTQKCFKDIDTGRITRKLKCKFTMYGERYYLVMSAETKGTTVGGWRLDEFEGPPLGTIIVGKTSDIPEGAIFDGEYESYRPLYNILFKNYRKTINTIPIGIRIARTTTTDYVTKDVILIYDEDKVPIVSIGFYVDSAVIDYEYSTIDIYHLVYTFETSTVEFSCKRITF